MQKKKKQIVCPICGHKFDLRTKFSEVIKCPKCESEIRVRRDNDSNKE